ncbi:MAG: helix-turn-helix domain-containing protein [Patescibacteria group bacterium]|nr:helix-turn-helix domain-containing protein [Patescibacteria group bacterium]MDD4695083.1 helix-turn-helix domain-containing protein [Patescibacteria group bacterium]
MIEDLDKIINKPFLTPIDLAKFFSISTPTVYRLVDQRVIKFYKIGGSLRFKKEDVLAYLDNVQVNVISK